ncbi:Aste57867_22957 [Aphanomyces stellatus]|uniref:Aste57867_22957 protein n=1 Tax=Aphanomyces stellatus TaxID=120398 RepID=A0A485LLE6_9STRA|nr:hypothetical protein As57867_022886 [Aphanomyces stellatus]VFT99607.1 Aste57867_22957 [Aphanomyces stellatus]
MTLRTREDFPYLSMRQPVVAREEIVRCPIETAADDIEKRTLSLRKIVLREERGLPNDVKAITHLLKGSINTEVNGGAPEVIANFFGDGAASIVDAAGEPMPAQAAQVQQAALRAALLRFLETALHVLSISRDLFRRLPHDGDGNDLALLAPLQGEFEKAFVKILSALAATYAEGTDEIAALRAAVSFKLGLA